MPPQKNSGNKKSKKESGVASKNRRFIQSFLDDIKSDDSTDGVYIGRILKKLGNGRMEVFYVKDLEGETRPTVNIALIRGTFRGKGKHAVWIDVGSIVAIAENELSIEIMAVLSREQVFEMQKHTDIDPRVLAINNTDENTLNNAIASDGFVFEDEQSVDIHVSHIKTSKLVGKEEVTEEDIDLI